MLLSKAAHFMNIVAAPAARWMNMVAAITLAAMMILVGTDVVLRYVFSSPIAGSYEIIQYAMTIVVAFGLAYCALEKGHIRVNLLVSRLSARGQAVINSIASLVFLALFTVIIWQSLLRALLMIKAGQLSEVLYFPLFPFALVVVAGCAVLCLVLLRDLLEYLSQAVKR